MYESPILYLELKSRNSPTGTDKNKLYLMYVDLDLVLLVVFCLCEDIIQVENQIRDGAMVEGKKEFSNILRGRSQMASRNFGQLLNPFPHRHAFYYKIIDLDVIYRRPLIRYFELLK